jgi:hypothetical protein
MVLCVLDREAQGAQMDREQGSGAERVILRIVYPMGVYAIHFIVVQVAALFRAGYLERANAKNATNG